MTSGLKIEQIHTDGMTGHISVHARIIETEGNASVTGPLEVIGIAPLIFKSKYGEDSVAAQKWLADVYAVMAASHASRKVVVAGLKQFEGKTIPFGEEATANVTGE